jgi:hypothetical protein
LPSRRAERKAGRAARDFNGLVEGKRKIDLRSPVGVATGTTSEAMSAAAERKQPQREGRAEAGQVGGVYQVEINAAGPEWFRHPRRLNLFPVRADV